MPHVNGIRIRNFRVLRDVRLRPLRPLTALIGDNGTGKTSFLEAVKMPQAAGQVDLEFEGSLTNSSLVCLEEPERGVPPAKLAALVDRLREQSLTTQVLFTTYSPILLDHLSPDEVWSFTLDAQGYTQVRCVGDDPIVAGLAQEGVPLGGLWVSGYFEDHLRLAPRTGLAEPARGGRRAGLDQEAERRRRREDLEEIGH